MVDAIIQQARIDLPMFRFGTILGMGGFGEVLQGTHIRSGIKCAVKVIPATDNPDDRKMYDREVQIMKDLLGSSTNLVELVDSQVTVSNWYLIMGLAHGGELLYGTLYTRREGRAKSLVRDITQGLKAMHDKGIIHADIKMANILLKSTDENSVAMIADFGLSKYVNDPVPLCGGTPGHMAPELGWASHVCGTAIDIWSLGILICDLFFLRRPKIQFDFVGDTDAKIIDFPAGKISLDAESFIRHCLNGDPAKRMTASNALEHPWLKEGGTFTVAAPTASAPPIVAPLSVLAPGVPVRRARVREAAPVAHRQRPNRGLGDKKIRNCSFI